MKTRTTGTTSRGRRGALALISTMLLASATLRLGLGANQAMALDQPPDSEIPAVETDCTAPDEIRVVLDALRTREERLDDQEAALARRMQALATAEVEIAARLEELVAAEAALRKTIALADSAAEDDIARLVAVYESMKPKDAALLFEKMDPSFASGFLARMSPEAAAGIMTGLDPETAYTFSAILAGRNASVPRQ